MLLEKTQVSIGRGANFRFEPMSDDPHPISQNLKLLCAEYRSVSEVCRKMGLNRQQFNKYLAGTSFPSPRTLLTMADFFGYDPDELQLPEREFARLQMFNRHRLNTLTNDRTAVSDIDQLKRYCGCYQTYHYVPGWQKNILVGFVRIHIDGRRVLSTFLEPPVLDGLTEARFKHLRMYGNVLLEGGFLYLVDHRNDANSSYSFTILYPSRSEVPHLLSGLSLSVSRQLNGLPYAANIVYERVDETANIRDRLRRLGRHDENSEFVPEPIVRSIRNEIRSGEYTLSHRF